MSAEPCFTDDIDGLPFVVPVSMSTFEKIDLPALLGIKSGFRKIISYNCIVTVVQAEVSKNVPEWTTGIHIKAPKADITISGDHRKEIDNFNEKELCTWFTELSDELVLSLE